MIAVYCCMLLLAAAPALTQKQGCCTPRQWEGYQAGVIGQVINGEGQVQRTRTFFAYDYNGKRTAAMSNITLSSGEVYHVTVVTLYNEKMMYSFDSSNPSVCQKRLLAGDMEEECVPANAEIVANQNFGLLPLKVVEFQFKEEIPGSDDDVDGTVSVAGDDNECIPVTESFYGQFGGVATLQALEFFNITSGISHSGVFDLPSSCDKGPALDEHDHHEMRMYGVMSKQIYVPIR